MARAFEIERLSGGDAKVLFPIVSAAFPRAEIGSWERFLRGVADLPPDRSGVLGLKREGGYFCGLLIYRNDRDPWHEARLVVDLFVAIDLLNSNAAIDALLDAAELQAKASRCAAIQISIDLHHKSLARRVRRAGYAVKTELLCKPCGPAQVN